MEFSPSLRKCINSSVQDFPDLEFLDEIGNLNKLVTKDDFLQIRGQTCPRKGYKLDSTYDSYYLTENGKLRHFNPNVRVFDELGRTDFCVDYLDYGNKTETVIIRCFSTEEEYYTYLFNRIYMMMISIAFFVLTFLVYVSIPELRNTHGKTFMSYITAITVTIILEVARFFVGQNYSTVLCKASGLTAGVVYFYGPAGVFFFINVILFLLTVRTIYTTSKNFDGLRVANKTKTSGNHNLFHLNVKLLLLMGINWTVEVVSWIMGPTKYDSIWYAGDIFNSLQGVVFFIVFFCNKRIMNMIIGHLKCVTTSFSETANISLPKSSS